MPKDYKHIQPKKKNAAGNMQHAKSFFAGLSVGLCVAVIVYFYQQNHQQPQDLIQPEIIVDTATPEVDPVDDTPPPTFDFYQILPNMEVNVSEYVAEEDDNIEIEPEHPTEDAGIYILQIGSFKQYEAADEVKAKLALMGISADIQRVVINGKDIRHRVRVGPYSDSEKLELVRHQLTENNLNYMLLKLKSGQ